MVPKLAFQFFQYLLDNKTKITLHNKQTNKQTKNKLEFKGEHLGRVDWERNSAEQDGRGQASKDLEVGL